MPALSDVLEFCDARTRRTAFKDFPGACNGLQIGNSGTVAKIGAAVDAGLKPFQTAVAAGVDFLIVHHGMYWDMPKPITGPVYDRVKTLMDGNCALYGNHLPLDGHPEIGNNALLAKQVDIAQHEPFMAHEGEFIGRFGPWGRSRDELKSILEQCYARVVAVEYGPTVPHRIAFCSGSGNSAIKPMIAAGMDTLVTGELREEWFNVAQEYGLNYYICGHYATEVHGISALASEAAAHFGIPWEFIATDNPL